MSQEIAERLLDEVLRKKEIARVVDTGCGSGRWGLRYLGKAAAIDFVHDSEQMLCECLIVARRQTTRTQVRGISASMDEMALLRSGEYDLCLCMDNSLSSTTNINDAVRELVRITAPGGHLFVSVDARTDWLRRFLEAGDYDLDRIDDFLTSGEAINKQGHPVHAFTPDELGMLFEDAGAATLGIWQLPAVGSYFLSYPLFQRKIKDVAFRARLVELELRHLNAVSPIGSHHIYGLFRKEPERGSSTK